MHGTHYFYWLCFISPIGRTRHKGEEKFKQAYDLIEVYFKLIVARACLSIIDSQKSDSLPPEEIKYVYLLDFVGPPGFVEDIAPKVERITILDHHKTALKVCV